MPQHQAASEAMQSVEARLISQELRQIRDNQVNQADTLRSIGQSLQVLSRVEANQGHLLDHLKKSDTRLDKHDQRLEAMERDMPGLLEMRRWVIGGVLGCLGLVGVAVVKLVLAAPYAWPHPQLPATPPPAVITPRDKP